MEFFLGMFITTATMAVVFMWGYLFGSYRYKKNFKKQNKPNDLHFG